jgi:hypothetical protein
MAMRVIQAMLMSRWRMRHLSCEHGIRDVWPRLLHVVVLVAATLLLEGCAELTEFRTDITHLRADLQANMRALSQLSARMDELERRQHDAERTARQTEHDLSQAIEVLLRKALISEDRQTTHELSKSWPKEAHNPEDQTGQHPSMRHAMPSRQGNGQPGRNHLSLGMSQDDVRRLFGEPTTVEPVGSYEFWHYSPTSNQQYIIFDKMSGQVLGWRGP